MATGRVLANVRPRDILAISDHDVWVAGNEAAATQASGWCSRTGTVQVVQAGQRPAGVGRAARTGPRGDVS